MRLTKRTPRQRTDVLKSLVPSVLKMIFTLSRFIGLKNFNMRFVLILAHTPRAIGIVDSRVITTRGQRLGISVSTSPARRWTKRESDRAIWLRAGGVGEG